MSEKKEGLTVRPRDKDDKARLDLAYGMGSQVGKMLGLSLGLGLSGFLAAPMEPALATVLLFLAAISSALGYCLVTAWKDR